MGTFDLTDVVHKTPDGKTLTFSSFTDTDFLIGVEGSGVWISVADEAGKHWGLYVERGHWSEPWEKRWIDAFCHHPAWREQFEAEEDGSGAHWAADEALPPLPGLPAQVAESRRSAQVSKLLSLGERARFKDFAELKSGNDQFSKLKGDALFSQLPEADRDSVKASDLDEEHQAKAARWVLRGLPLDWAQRKVKTDMEVSANAEASRKSRSNRKW